jgi:hypothetical protein
VFEASQVLERFEKIGDLHAPVLKLKQKLPDLRGVTAAAGAETATVDLAAQAEEEQTVASRSRTKSPVPITRNKQLSSRRGKAAAKKKQRAV